MDSEFKSFSFSVCKSLKHETGISLGHVQQSIAAGLGYHTLAAYQAQAANRALHDHLIYYPNKMRERVVSLGFPPELANTIIDYFSTQISPLKHAIDVERLREDVEEYVRKNVEHQESVNSAMATTNAYCNGFVETEVDLPELPVFANSGSMEIPVSGHIEMDQDPDRTFCGDLIAFDGAVYVSTSRGISASLEIEKLEVSADVDTTDYYE